MSRIGFKIVYRSGKAGGKLDALTRRTGDLPKEGDDRLLANQQALLKPQNLPKELILSAIDPTIVLRPRLATLITGAYQVDPAPNKILQLRRNGTRHLNGISLADCSKVDGQLRYHDCLYVSEHNAL